MRLWHSRRTRPRVLLRGHPENKNAPTPSDQEGMGASRSAGRPELDYMLRDYAISIGRIVKKKFRPTSLPGHGHSDHGVDRQCSRPSATDSPHQPVQPATAVAQPMAGHDHACRNTCGHRPPRASEGYHPRPCPSRSRHRAHGSNPQVLESGSPTCSHPKPDRRGARGRRPDRLPAGVRPRHSARLADANCALVRLAPHIQVQRLL